MMRNCFKKTLSLMLALMTVGPVAACGNPIGMDSGESVGEDGKLAGEMQIIAPDLGFGLDWLRNLEAGFEAKNPDVKIELKSSTLTDKVHVYLTSMLGHLLFLTQRNSKR